MCQRRGAKIEGTLTSAGSLRIHGRLTGAITVEGNEAGAILAATPFGILMVPMCYGLLKTLRSDRRDEERREIEEIMTPQQAPTGPSPRPATGGPAAQQMTAEDPLERGRRRTSE